MYCWSASSLNLTKVTGKSLHYCHNQIPFILYSVSNFV
jgi:hypothetical protein